MPFNLPISRLLIFIPLSITIFQGMMNAGRGGGFGYSGVFEPFLISHKMSVLLNVIILTCTEAWRDAPGSCQHRALCSKTNKKSTTNSTQPRAIKIFIEKRDLTITVISKT